MGIPKCKQLQLPFSPDEWNLILPKEENLRTTPKHQLIYPEIMEILGNPIKLKEWDRCKRAILNKHLLPAEHPVEGKFELPKLKPYTGPIPNHFLPYSARIPANSSQYGVHCHIDDKSFSSSWNQPVKGLNRVIQYKLAIGPDFSLFVDGKTCENIEQLRRNRTITSFWQYFIPTIQSASWGDADSVLNFAFDGLAEGSWTSISHAAIGNKHEQQLFEFAVRHLVTTKRPLGLLVFGFPLNFDPGIQVRTFPCRINYLRNLKGK